MSETVRVAMMFPADLKEQLQELAGPRNMTTWVLNAIYDKLERKAEGALDPAEAKTLENQLKEARQLAQVLADAIAATDDDPNPQRALQNRHLPDWLNQSTWPIHLKGEAKPTPVVQVGGTPPERQVKPLEEPTADWVETAPREEVLEKFEELQPEPTIGPEPTEVPEVRDAFLARIQAKAKELGVMTASELPTKTAVVVEEPIQDEATEPAPLSQIKDPNACSTCGSELVDGECWWCA